MVRVVQRVLCCDGGHRDLSNEFHLACHQAVTLHLYAVVGGPVASDRPKSVNFLVGYKGRRAGCAALPCTICSL
jgi:hypothetical protein